MSGSSGTIEILVATLIIVYPSVEKGSKAGN